MNYILYGNDENRMKQKMDSLKKKHAIEELIAFDCNQSDQSDILNEMDSFSIFDQKKMLILKNASFLSSKDTTHFNLEAFAKRSDANDQLIVVYCCLSEKLDKRKKLVKQMIEQSTVISCLNLDDQSKNSYLIELMKEKKVSFDRDAFKWFSNRVGNNPIRIESEVEKCSIYSDHITLEDCKALVSIEPLDNVFKMTDALLDGKALLLLSYYRNFRKLNMSSSAIVSLLSGQLRFLFQVRVCMEKGLNQNQIAQEMHAHPYRIKVNMQRAYRFDLDQLLDQLCQLAEYDQSRKLGLVNEDEGFEQFILNLLKE